ncbi:hypothetical protein NDU88_001548 [Pleurodeles waltl]|uniref:Uncharacterized protein n=1 Tax=Pleurodeles waltl TaxID=8319 RepID=A0AAV7U7B3_PLEWA|nr:hypothetical protein NDU88_001548 [Pleurodeles waltl]
MVQLGGGRQMSEKHEGEIRIRITRVKSGVCKDAARQALEESPGLNQETRVKSGDTGGTLDDSVAVCLRDHTYIY